MRAIVDRYSREEVEHSELPHRLGLLVLCCALLDRLQHPVQRFIIGVDVLEHAEVESRDEVLDLGDLLQAARLIRKGAPAVVLARGNVVVLIDADDDCDLVVSYVQIRYGK